MKRDEGRGVRKGHRGEEEGVGKCEERCEEVHWDVRGDEGTCGESTCGEVHWGVGDPGKGDVGKYVGV